MLGGVPGPRHVVVNLNMSHDVSFATFRAEHILLSGNKTTIRIYNKNPVKRLKHIIQVNIHAGSF